MKTFLGIVLAASILFNIKQYVDAVEYKETAEESVAAKTTIEGDIAECQKVMAESQKVMREQFEEYRASKQECEKRAAEWLAQRNELLKQLPSVEDIEITGNVKDHEGKPLPPDLERKCKAAVQRAQAQLDIARELSYFVDIIQGDPKGKTEAERLNRFVVVIKVPVPE